MSFRLARRGRRGFTLLEMSIAVAVFSLVIGSALRLALDGQSTTRATQGRSEAARQARRALDRVVAEMKEAAANAITPDPSGPEGASSAQFQHPTNVVGGVVTWSGVFQALWESAPEDPLGGGDDDGDGLVDEGRLVLVRNLGMLTERRIVLANDVPRLDPDEADNDLDDNGNGVVDETGFNVQRVGDVFTLRLAVSNAAEGGAPRYVGRAEASIRLRN